MPHLRRSSTARAAGRLQSALVVPSARGEARRAAAAINRLLQCIALAVGVALDRPTGSPDKARRRSSAHAVTREPAPRRRGQRQCLPGAGTSRNQIAPTGPTTVPVSPASFGEAQVAHARHRRSGRAGSWPGCAGDSAPSYSARSPAGGGEISARMLEQIRPAAGGIFGLLPAIGAGQSQVSHGGLLFGWLLGRRTTANQMFSCGAGRRRRLEFGARTWTPRTMPRVGGDPPALSGEVTYALRGGVNPGFLCFKRNLVVFK